MRVHIGLHLRAVEASDRYWMWELANDPLARQMSFNSGLIPWDEHCVWFAALARDPESLAFVVQVDNGSRVGLIRFKVEGVRAIVGVNIAEEHRGRGLAAGIIEEGTQHLLACRPRVLAVDAFIKFTNEASVRAFERAGYSRVGDSEVKGQPALWLVKER